MIPLEGECRENTHVSTLDLSWWGDTCAQPRRGGRPPFPCLSNAFRLDSASLFPCCFCLGNAKPTWLIVIFFLMGGENMDVFIL